MREIPKNFVRYFSAELLALYANQPDRYSVETDYFSGEIETSSAHFDQAHAAGQHLIHVRFGFRTMRGGDLALAVLAPDLKDASPDERATWLGFEVDESELPTQFDRRFQMWVDRYIHGSWDVEDGVLMQIRHELHELNALVHGAIGVVLYQVSDLATLTFPTAQNNHRYHDAHSEAYKLLIDGLSKDALKRLGAKLGKTLQGVDSERTLKVLTQLLPDDVATTIRSAFETISINRRLADHQKRPPATAMAAFESFDADLKQVVGAMRLLKETLSRILGITVRAALARYESLTCSFYPKFDEN